MHTHLIGWCLCAALALAGAGCSWIAGDDVERGIEAAVSAADAETAARQAALKDRCSLADYRAFVACRGGTNVWTEALQRALDEHEIVVVPAAAEPYYFDRTVLVPSNRRIEAAGATIRCLPGMRTVLLRNVHVRDGTWAPAADAPRDDNIAVAGGRWEDCWTSRRGYGSSGMFNLEPRRHGNYFGVSTLFLFGDVDHVRVSDVTFHHTAAFAIQAGDGDAHCYERLRFDECFADGVHLNGNLTRVHVKDAKGMVGDDLVALNAYDWLDSSVHFGPQRNILCEDLELVLEKGRGYPAIRIQPAKYKYRDGSIVDCAISNVIFRRVKGIMTFKMYLQTPRYAIGESPEWAQVGGGGNLYFEDIDIDLAKPIDGFRDYTESDPVRGHFAAFEFGANLSSVTFRDIDITFHADRYPLSHLATVGPKSCYLPATTTAPAMEIFDPYVSCRVGVVKLRDIRTHGVVPAELVHATVFDDVDRDGRSSGRGEIVRLESTRVE